MNYAILLSGGKGTRIGSDIPKQYISTGGQMMISYSVKTLIESNMIDAVYIVAEDEWREKISEDIKNADKIAVVNDHGIMELGTHEELMAKQGEYYKLQSAQLAVQ